MYFRLQIAFFKTLCDLIFKHKTLLIFFKLIYDILKYNVIFCIIGNNYLNLINMML